MVNKTTKYEQKRAARFTRRDNERRELLRRLSSYDPLYDMYEPWSHALITLIDEFTRIDEDTIRAYLNKHNDPADICIECEDCDEVLVSAEIYDYEEETE